MMTGFDDPDLGIPEGQAVLRSLAAVSPHVAALMRGQEEALGETLGTILLDQVGQWYVESLSTEHTESTLTEVDRVVARLATLYDESDEVTRGVIAAGFLESLPLAGKKGRDSVEQLPPTLRAALRDMERG